MNWRRRLTERQEEDKKLETRLRIKRSAEKAIGRGDIEAIERQYVPWLRRRG